MLNPNYLDVYFARGNIYMNTGDYQNAVDDYTYLLTRDPAHAGALQNRAIVRGNTGDFMGAMDDLNQAVSLNPSSGSAYYLRGIAKFEVGLNGCEDLSMARSLQYQGAERAIQHYCR